jgi:hypothetical protein
VSRPGAQHLRGIRAAAQQLRSHFFVSLGISRFSTMARSLQVFDQPLMGCMKHVVRR